MLIDCTILHAYWLYHITCSLPVPYCMLIACTILHAYCLYHITCSLTVPYYMLIACTILHAYWLYHITCSLTVPYYILIACTILHAYCLHHITCLLPAPYCMRMDCTISQSLTVVLNHKHHNTQDLRQYARKTLKYVSNISLLSRSDIEEGETNDILEFEYVAKRTTPSLQCMFILE